MAQIAYCYIYQMVLDLGWKDTVFLYHLANEILLNSPKNQIFHKKRNFDNIKSHKTHKLKKKKR